MLGREETLKELEEIALREFGKSLDELTDDEYNEVVDIYLNSIRMVI